MSVLNNYLVCDELSCALQTVVNWQLFCAGRRPTVGHVAHAVFLFVRLDYTHGLSVGPTVFHGKLCQIPWTIWENSTAHCGKIIGSLFVSKLSSVLFRNLKTGIVLSYANNIQKISIFFHKWNMPSRLCLFMTVP